MNNTNRNGATKSNRNNTTDVVVLIEEDIINHTVARHQVSEDLKSLQPNIRFANKSALSTVFKRETGLAAYAQLQKKAIIVVFKKDTTSDSVSAINSLMDTGGTSAVYTNRTGNWKPNYFSGGTKVDRINVFIPVTKKVPAAV